MAQDKKSDPMSELLICFRPLGVNRSSALQRQGAFSNMNFRVSKLHSHPLRPWYACCQIEMHHKTDCNPRAYSWSDIVTVRWKMCSQFRLENSKDFSSSTMIKNCTHSTNKTIEHQTPGLIH